MLKGELRKQAIAHPVRKEVVDKGKKLPGGKAEV